MDDDAIRAFAKSAPRLTPEQKAELALLLQDGP
jgi:hypothetical protein